MKHINRLGLWIAIFPGAVIFLIGLFGDDTFSEMSSFSQFIYVKAMLCLSGLAMMAAGLVVRLLIRRLFFRQKTLHP